MKSVTTFGPLGILITCNTGLLLYGLVLAPSALGAGLLAAIAMQAASGLVLVFTPLSVCRGDRRSIALSLVLGGLFGVIYGALLLSEYVLPVTTQLSIQTGTAAIAALAGVTLTTGFAVAYGTRSVGQAIFSAGRAAIVGTLIFVCAYFAITYLFWGSDKQQLVLQAEGTFEDFTRSGGGDFSRFLIQDMQGAAFFHLMLSVIVGLALGAIGGMLGRLAGELKRQVRCRIRQ